MAKRRGRGKAKGKSSGGRRKSKPHQTGRSNPLRDSYYKAKPPGKRVSRSGRTYYEYRKNRSDLSPEEWSRAGRPKAKKEVNVRIEARPSIYDTYLLVAKGDTYENRDKLKHLGFKWNPGLRLWVLEADRIKSRSQLQSIARQARSIGITFQARGEDYRGLAGQVKLQEYYYSLKNQGMRIWVSHECFTKPIGHITGIKKKTTLKPPYIIITIPEDKLSLAEKQARTMGLKVKKLREYGKAKRVEIAVQA